MTSSNGNIFRVTGPLCGEFTGPVNSPHKGQWRGALMFSLICVWINGWVNNGEAGDLRRHRSHYDVNVMWISLGHQDRYPKGNLIIAVSSCWHTGIKTWSISTGLVWYLLTSPGSASASVFITSRLYGFSSCFERLPRQQTSLAQRWPNVDPVGSTLSQRGPSVPCYLGSGLLHRINRTMSVVQAECGLKRHGVRCAWSAPTYC